MDSLVALLQALVLQGRLSLALGVVGRIRTRFLIRYAELQVARLVQRPHEPGLHIKRVSLHVPRASRAEGLKVVVRRLGPLHMSEAVYGQFVAELHQSVNGNNPGGRDGSSGKGPNTVTAQSGSVLVECQPHNTDEPGRKHEGLDIRSPGSPVLVDCLVLLPR
eukprot:scaffold1202_cov384-Prasinococcus_capsulatus_cf.AAC.12